jgi:hypothetical protein
MHARIETSGNPKGTTEEDQGANHVPGNVP